MEWLEVQVIAESGRAEDVASVLLLCGVEGIQIIDRAEMRRFLQEAPFKWDYIDESLLAEGDDEARVIFYLTPDGAGYEKVRQINGLLSGLLTGFDIQTSTVNDSTWLDEWKNYYKPLRIGKSVVIRPVWEEYTPRRGDTVFTIDPGSVFGTGRHQSTRLCIEALQMYARPGLVVPNTGSARICDCSPMRPGQNVLDIGCGSGILSIISLLLGAEHALACDFEPAAVASALENARLNGIEEARYTVMAGDIFTDEALRGVVRKQRYGIVLANIVADAIIRLAPDVRGYLAEGGAFIASGIIGERLSDVNSALTKEGFTVSEILEADNWYCVVCLNA